MSDPHNTTGALEPVEQGAVTRRTDAPSPLDALLANPDRLNDLPIETAERLYAMREKELARLAEQEFNTALHAVRREMKVVPRLGRNPSIRSDYAKLEDVADMIDPLLDRHGFTRSTSHGDSPVQGHLRFVMTLRHVGGHAVEFPWDSPPDSSNKAKTPMQAVASATSYAERQLLLKAFGIQTGEDRDGAAPEQHEPSTDDQCADIRTLLADIGRSEADFCKSRMVERIEDLPKGAAESALRQLERMARS